MIVISNTTPIISLCSANAHFILKELFNEIHIPVAVNNELRTSEKYGFDFGNNSWVNIFEVKNRQSVNILLKDLDLGESEVIIGSLELKAKVTLIDENIGYNIAKFYKINVNRTLSLLKTAKELGIIKQVKPIVEEMINNGRWYSERLIKDFLSTVEE
jgi:uncharacterized protein